MNPKILLTSLLLATSNMAVSAGYFDDLMRNVPQPGSRQAETKNAIGGETARTGGLEAENSYLRKLIIQQNEKIELLESRLKQLEAKK